MNKEEKVIPVDYHCKEMVLDVLTNFQNNLNNMSGGLFEKLKNTEIENGKLKKENKQLKEQLEYIRSGEYYNQLRFERDMLQDLVDKGEISKEDKEFIDCSHRNTELLEVIDKAIEKIEKHNLKAKAGNTCELDEYILIQDLLEILKGDSNE